MMADARDCAPMAVRAVEIGIGDPPARWAALGFDVRDGACTVGGVRLVLGGEGEGILRVAFTGLTADRPDGLPFVAAGDPPGAGDSTRAAAPGPIGAVAVDHVVAFTDDLARTTGALEAAGLPLRRVREQARQAFLPAGTLVVEVVETGASPSLWGLVISVADLDGAVDRLGGLAGVPRDAVQPGRRIATVRPEAGLSVALALMTPRA
jgi:hypothetical protein